MTSAMEKTSNPVRRAMAEPWPRLFDWLDSLTPGELTWHPHYDHVLRLEQAQRDGQLILRLEIPGVDPEEDIDITLEDDVLTIDARREERHEEKARSEFHYGRLQRCISLPQGIDEDDISAAYVDGILEIAITMPNGETRPESTRSIPIKS